jgi:hypothetical protein
MIYDLFCELWLICLCLQLCLQILTNNDTYYIPWFAILKIKIQLLLRDQLYLQSIITTGTVSVHERERLLRCMVGEDGDGDDLTGESLIMLSS